MCQFRSRTTAGLWVWWLVLYCILPYRETAAAQQASSASNSQANYQALQTLDKLVEQNKQLEQQNRSLMSEIETLRQSLAKQSEPGTGAVPPSPQEPGSATPGSEVMTQEDEAQPPAANVSSSQ